MTKSLTLWVGRGELNVWRYSAVLQRKYCLDQTRYARSSFSMSNIWFDLDQSVRNWKIEGRKVHSLSRYTHRSPQKRYR
jgi:hypothetical protein